MKIPKWKKAISYIYPFVLKKYKSKHSGLLEIGLQNGKLVLDSKNANYSFGSLHKVFDKAINNIKFDSKKTYKTLILGFGVGSIAQLLQNKQSKFEIIGVELDKTVIELGEKYFDTKKIPNCRIIAENAMDFIGKNKQFYDLIFVDLFIDDKVPAIFQEKSFLKKLRNKLNKNGHLMMNNMSLKDKQIEIIKNTLSPCFIYSYFDTNSVFHYHNKH